jgi:hypothetical protein
MIRHILLVKFKSKSSPKKIQEVLEDFQSIPTKIDGISDVEWGENNSPEQLNDGYSNCIQITFTNEEGRQNYLAHPEHETLKRKFTDVLEKIVVFDYSI